MVCKVESLAPVRVGESVCGWFDCRVTVSAQSLALPTLCNQQLIYGPRSPAEPLPLQWRLEKGDALHCYSCARFHDSLLSFSRDSLLANRSVAILRGGGFEWDWVRCCEARIIHITSVIIMSFCNFNKHRTLHVYALVILITVPLRSC